MMTGSEQGLEVYLGHENIAKISLINDQLYWEYYDHWLHEGYAVSPHLPFYEKISPLNTQRFLRNLLPEGEVLEELVRSLY
jgi:serine/threonine-protein kinase HipA